jgi:polyribonucleotide nucleotidyltransferase
MFNIIKKEMDFGGRTLSIETGKIARQAHSVMARYGDTVVLCAVTFNKEASEGVDFLPLTVNYIEKFYAIGKIPGGFLKREGKPSDKEVLTSRVIDRTIRPMFPEGFYNDIQVVCTLLSYDNVNDPDVVALIATSAALRLAGLPIMKTVAVSRLAKIDGEFIINPSPEQLSNPQNKLDLTVAGTDTSVLMVESEAHELSEKEMLEAVWHAQKSFVPVIKMIDEFALVACKKQISAPNKKDEINVIIASVSEKYKQDIISGYAIKEKAQRYETLANVRSKINDEFLCEGSTIDPINLKVAISKIEESIVRSMILDEKKRIDGRSEDDIRQIEVETAFLPRIHGSALFTRGETQAIVTTTLGAPIDGQSIDGIDGMSKSMFMLHYNFPPYSVGEAYGLKPTGRREIGHGKLAFKAIRPMLDIEKFPYSIRVVSDITESNGSSSMATVCGSSLSLMDAGVPMKRPVAGIAMGLIKEGEKFAVLTDIMGDEDHLGDMDFKVAGTDNGITALQMDIKIDGISEEIMSVALEKALKARMHILGKMSHAIKESRPEVNANAPQMSSFEVPKSAIGEVIGKGGANIKGISEKYSVKIDISETGLVSVFATSKEDAEKVKTLILECANDLEYGKKYTGIIAEVKSFGAIIKLESGKSGLIHISQISEERIEDVSTVLREGQVVEATYLGTDEKGRSKFSMKPHNGNSDQPRNEDRGDRRERGDRGDRRHDRGDRNGSDRRDRNDDRKKHRDEDDMIINTGIF